MLPEIDLTDMQREALRSVFAPFADKLAIVGVYGSRAMGCARPGSDVDLVIFGEVTHDDVGTIRGDLEDSDLSIFADVVAYDAISNDRLRDEIDRWSKPLFRRADLIAR